MACFFFFLNVATQAEQKVSTELSTTHNNNSITFFADISVAELKLTFTIFQDSCNRHETDMASPR